MTAENWARVRTLVEAALDQPEEDRATFLDMMCSDDPELRFEVEELLTLEPQADSLFAEVDRDLDYLAIDCLPAGTRLGAYRIVKLVGEGGMGSVYLAERADAVYSQLVAVKVVQRGIASKEAIERFARERQTLARLHHAGIARLLDGGITADGRPYLVMEYVEGRPIHQFCDEERLTVRERVELVLRICEAVQSAHQNLIIHRDLKPANILVTATGDPKLLDFGIAKWLDAVPESNALTVRMLTPSYASPEQACGEPVSTATDVYALAALLFELLSGSLPHPTSGLPAHEAVRLLLEMEPRLASEVVREEAAGYRKTSAKALQRTLRGDLDTILRQALRREPGRRYSTVQAFAADLKRYLDGLPVQARPDTLLYRAGKLVRRRKAAVLIGAASFCGITLAMVGMWRGYATARDQRAIAERRYENGRKLVQSYLTEVDRKLEGMPGTTEVRSLIAHRNLEYLDRMSADAKSDVALQRELAQAYFLIGRTQRMMAKSSADRQQVRLNMEKAARLRQAIFANTGDILDRGQLAYLLSQIGSVLVQDGRLKEAIAYHKNACTLAQPIFGESAVGLNYLRAANACWNLATDYSGNEQAPYSGRFEEGLKGQLEALSRFERWRDSNPDNAMGYPYVASMEAMAAGDYWRMGQYEQARRHFEAALSILHGPHGMLSHELAAGYLVMAQVDYSMMLADWKESRAALPHAQEAWSVARKEIAAQKGNDPGWESIGAFAEVAMGRALVLNTRVLEGMGFLKRGLSTLRSLYAEDPSDAEAASAVAKCELWVLDADMATHSRALAKQHCREVIALSDESLRRDPDDASAIANGRKAREMEAKLD